MGIKNLTTNQLNQNGYSTNTQTREKIGALYTFPIDYTPSDCLSCEGFVLKIADYKQLYSIIGKRFNKGTEQEDEFRIPDYNITELFINNDKDIFNNLLKSKDEIETKLGFLDWQDLEGKKSSRIRQVLHYDITDTSNLDETIKSHIKMAEDFKETFRKFL